MLHRLKTIPVWILCSAFSAFAADTAPDFTLPDLDGGKYKLSAHLKDGPVLVDFWATWCEPCKAELPHIQSFHETYMDAGLQVLAITIDDPKSISRVKPYIRGKGYTFKVLLDSNSEVRKSFGGTLMPYTTIISKDGEVLYRHLGYSPGDEVALEKAIRKALNLPVEESGEGAVDPAAGGDQE